MKANPKPLHLVAERLDWRVGSIMCLIKIVVAAAIHTVKNNKDHDNRNSHNIS